MFALRFILFLAAAATMFGATPAPAPAQAPAAETVVISQRVRLEGGMTRADAERVALEAAMAEAVRRVAGVRVAGT
ncbi:MAG: hypothetical protein NTW72_08910, partial [Gemmatimonadetes bacterium]|nr:hypothetical protein [Gemmatimonadota bacterium]